MKSLSFSKFYITVNLIAYRASLSESFLVTLLSRKSPFLSKALMKNRKKKEEKKKKLAWVNKTRECPLRHPLPPLNFRWHATDISKLAEVRETTTIGIY